MTGRVDEWFAAVMLGLAEVFGAKLTDQRILLYAQALADLPQPQVERAAQRAIRECRWFPTPKELREFVEPSAEEAALLAWSGFQRAASEVGAWAPLVVDDPHAAAAFRAVFGSWGEYCACDGPAVGSRKSEFLAAYRDSRRTPVLAVPTRLQGLCDYGGNGAVTWAGRLTASGEVQKVRERFLLEGGTTRALPEAGEAQDGEGA